MSQPASASRGSSTPGTLRPASLWKRAAVGLLVLTFGVVVAAWLLHASIDEAAALNDSQHVAAPGVSANVDGNSR